jgi:hypothetical protein
MMAVPTKSFASQAVRWFAEAWVYHGDCERFAIGAHLDIVVVALGPAVISPSDNIG